MDHSWVVRVVPLILSQIPWFVEPGVADGAASGRFGLMRDIQWSWCAPCRASFFPQGFITILSYRFSPATSVVIFSSRKSGKLWTWFFGTHSRRVGLFAWLAGRYSVAAAHRAALRMRPPSHLGCQVYKLYTLTLFFTQLSLCSIFYCHVEGHNNPNLWQKMCLMSGSWRTFCTFCRKTAPWLYVEHCTVASWVWEV